MRKWGTPQNFCLAFIDELKKKLLKKLLKWTNRKRKNFSIYKIAYFSKKIKKNTWRCDYFTPAYQKS